VHNCSASKHNAQWLQNGLYDGESVHGSPVSTQEAVRRDNFLQRIRERISSVRIDPVVPTIRVGDDLEVPKYIVRHHNNAEQSSEHQARGSKKNPDLKDLRR